MVLPGFLSDSREYNALCSLLRSRGHPTAVVDMRTVNWVPTLAGGAFSFYLDSVERTVLAHADAFGAPCTLVAHSAGGWLARIWLGSEVYNGRVYAGASKGLCDALVTLGTPHHTLELYPFGRIPERRKGEKSALSRRAQSSSAAFANECYPGAFEPHVTYLSVCGRAVQGEAVTMDGRMAAFAYKCISGPDGASAWGDGVTDVGCADLNIGVPFLAIDGVYHSPGSTRTWYGSPEVLPVWLDRLDELRTRCGAG